MKKIKILHFSGAFFLTTEEQMLFCFVTYDVLMIGYQHCHSTTFGLYTGLNVRHLFGCFWRHFQISNHHVCYCDRKILPPHDSFASSSSRGQA